MLQQILLMINLAACGPCGCPADFSRQLSEFETHADAPPVAMAWCGGDAVVLQWPELLLIVGPHGDHAAWSTDTKVWAGSFAICCRGLGSFDRCTERCFLMVWKLSLWRAIVQAGSLCRQVPSGCQVDESWMILSFCPSHNVCMLFPFSSHVCTLFRCPSHVCVQTVLVPEVDGVRLLTSSRHELLRKVPSALAEVRRLWS